MANHEISVRKGELEDAAELAELIGQMGYESDEAQMRSRLPRILEHPDILTIVAERAGRIVGYAGAWCGPSYEADSPHARLMVIVVDATERRRGIAARLMRTIEAWAQERGAGYIVLGSGRHRSDAHAFYEGLGYESRGRRYLKRLDASP